MPQAHRLDCETEAADCRFIVQSEDESEAIELARNHMKEVHGQELTDDDLRHEHMETV
ncbi:DUF1059 domain-containing protein [Halobiforma lacisalsi AJ5]|uniref:DUF1059 domain-containing protein n=1 Tax=Natronobacterium lacisalsi AJ5 TaxID=358396 RepID=M0LX49_NATLA|nr:DUF1059 domain-containing protein [Halobiforma lacisalsi]APW97686.1 DUF1059 domain-containing protein [Halobiforma lacisalsi AJ5]EMA36924.1 hypothetical protein C445_01741 [Halobiforma lacisalsi AJ5]